MVEHNARSRAESEALCRLPWRQGRKVPRNVYAHDGEDDGVAIGTFDSEWLAQAAVVAHNRTHGYSSDGLSGPCTTEQAVAYLAAQDEA